jgi:hypothetical protein
LGAIRLLFAVGLVLSMSGAEIERAQAVARARDSERQQFHQRYVISLPDPVVPQIEVVTEFRRLVIIAEDHVLRGDWMFTRSVRAAVEALAPTRGVITIKAEVRFSPLNAFVEPPPYTLAIGASSAGSALEAVSTQLTPQYSVPFTTRDGKTLSSLIGADLEAKTSAGQTGQTARAIGVMLSGKEITRTTVDFSRLD